MIVDSSAIVAYLFDEPGRERIEVVLGGASAVGIGAPTLVEAEMVLVSELEELGRKSLGDFLGAFGIDVLPFGEPHWREASRAFERFGKGRHPAGLNLGDCFSYATAKVARRPLICVGDDFPKTDLEVVPLPPSDDVTD